MKIVLWILQVVLAAVFLAHGWMLLNPPPDLIEAMNEFMSPAFRNFLGVAEVAAAVGLTLPGITRILPWLTSWAAAGVAIVTISATVFHIMRGETSSAITTAILFAMATYLAYMRWRVLPIAPRRADQGVGAG